MAAIEPILSDQQSVDVIMDSITNELQGLAWLFCNMLAGKLQTEVDPANVTIEDVQKQTAILKSILCGYTAKESAIASVIKAAAKKTAVDLNVDPSLLCQCLSNKCNCNCK